MRRIPSRDARSVVACAALMAGSALLAAPRAYVSHRGDYADAPEASMAAFRNAVTLGADVVKLDVNPSKDGIVFISHDTTLNRTLGWNVRVEDVTSDEILGHVFNYRVFGAPLSTERLVMLRQALRMMKGRIPRFWVDFKTFSPDFAEKVLRDFAAEGVDRSRIMVATDPYGPALAYMRDHHPEIPCFTHIDFIEYPNGIWASFGKGRRFRDAAELEKGILDFAAEMKLAGVNMLDIPEIATKELVDHLRAKGLLVSIAVVNSEREANLFREYETDFVVSGNLRAVRPILGKRTK